MSADIEKDYQCLLKHQDVAVDQFQNTGLSPPESLQGLLDAYIAELKIKRQKLREKRKPSKGTNANQTAGRRTSARRMTMTTTTITITLKISSSPRIVPRWPGLHLGHPRPLRATQAQSRAQPEETLSSRRIRPCRTCLMETAQTNRSRSSACGRKTCCA